MKEIDCRGLSCPGPVIQVKKALEEMSPGESITAHVDSEASRDNVRRFVLSRGLNVKVEDVGESEWIISIDAPKGNMPHSDAETRERGDAGTLPVVFIAADTLGTGDDKLGRILMEGFVNTLVEHGQAPDKVLFMNGGVRLAVEGSPLLAALRNLTDLGCEILVCGTCLDFFGIKEKLAVGTVSNMYDIQRAMLEASKVVRP